VSFYTTRPSEYLHTHTGKKNEYGCADFGAALQQIDDNIGGGKVGWLSEVNAMHLRLILSFFISLLFVGAVRAGDFEDGFSAYQRQDFATALAKFRSAAQKGDLSAHLVIAIMYYEGKGVAQDYKEATRWYKLAAQQGDPLAQFNLASMYEKGQGVAQDDKEAIRLYKLAAKQNSNKAQANLGAMYYDGNGVLQDYVRAHMWFSIAASGGDNEGAKNRDTAERKMTAQQVEQARRMARECMNSKFTKCY
jgi:TPR repeat protein